MKLSILIPSLEKREDQLFNLLTELYKQIIDTRSFLTVEILTNIDNKEKTTGAKRNELLLSAHGEYVCFIDDDDEVYSWYISSILKAIETSPDCVATCGHYSVDGGEKQFWKLNKDFSDHDSGGILYRRSNHLTPIKREHALKAMFPDKSNAEDKAYSERVNPYLKTQTEIYEPVYHYKYQSQNKEYV
jgi:glycosyltransferase involved in cell wall biosynthesis